MSKKITAEKFESFILECINKMEIGEKVIFTKDEMPHSADHKITLMKTDDERFEVVDRGNENLEFSNLDFVEAIKDLIELKEKEFPNCDHLFAHKE